MSATGPGRADSLYRDLRELIVSGQIAPGSRLTEVGVADRMGVSRTPVRSAFQRLRQEGFLVRDGGSGRSPATVAPLTRDDARELFLIIGQIEGLAAFFAAEQDEESRGRLVERLESCNARLAEEAATKSPDFESLRTADSEFHRTYVDAGAGPRLHDLHDALKPQSERYVRVYVRTLTAEMDVSVREHAEIIEAIREGSPPDAESRVKTNWRNAASRLGAVIEDRGELGSW